jgi:putative SOS response-associated peptidase YedK
MFRGPMIAARCLIPAASYFEWEKRGGQTIKYRLRPKEDGLFYFAGLYRSEAGKDVPRFVILTAPAADGMSFIHDRMPVMLPEKAQDGWLNDAQHAPGLLEEGVRDIVYEPCGQAEQLKLW